MSHLFDEIDGLVNLDIGGRGVRKLYKAARKETPLCLECAELMRGKKSVVITTGFPILPDLVPETDGPPGAIALARAIKEIGGEPFFVTEEMCRKILLDASKSVGFDVKVVSLDEAFSMSPSLLISIEKPGVNSQGRYHSMKGADITEVVEKVDPLFEDANEKGIPTIGIGDGGNEIGMGKIKETVMREIPLGEKICAVTETKSLMVSAVSNWGAYGIIAALSLLEKCQLLHDGNDEEKMLRACVDSGAVDGITKRRELSVDRIPLEFHKHLVEMLREIVFMVIS